MFDFTGMQPKFVPVTMPDGSKYVLREPSGEADIAKHTAMYGAVDVNGELNKAGFMQHVKESEAVFVAHCLFPEGSDKHVSVGFVKSLSLPIYTQLLKWVEAVNGDEAGPKAVSANTPTGST